MNLQTLQKILLVLLLFLHFNSNAQKTNMMNEFANTIFPKGDKAPADYFTGTAWVNILVPKDETGTYSIGNVVFEPGCRTNWHIHPAGQTLIVSDGKGWCQEKGKQARPISKGDVVVIPSNVEHWHGATKDNSLTHLAVTNNSKEGAVKWLQPVSDAEYNNIHKEENTSSTKTILSEEAIKNHEELWPGYQSKAMATDPELIEVFDNFAFDDVISHDTMDTKIRVTLIMASTIGSQALTEYKMFVNAALNVGVTPVEIKEVLYQAVPYVGIAKVIDFIYATNEIFTGRDIALPLPPQANTNFETRIEKGLEKQKEIIGDRVYDMYKNSPKDLLHIQQYLSANCFGDYITRDGLDIKTRELVTLSFFIALGGTEPQIKGHIQGNANVGNDRQTLINVITHLIPYVGYPRTLNAISCLNEVLPANNN